MKSDHECKLGEKWGQSVMFTVRTSEKITVLMDWRSC